MSDDTDLPAPPDTSGTADAADHTCTPQRPRIRTQADLEATWWRLMAPLGFSRHSIWFLLIGDDDRPVPQIVEVEEAVRPPTVEGAAGFAEVVRTLLDDLPGGGRLALLRSRPGAGGPDADDLAWARALTTACRALGVVVDVVHVATDTDLVPLPYDALAAA